MYEAHFIPCTPGEHVVGFYYFMSPGGTTITYSEAVMAAALTHQTIRVNVEQGKVAELFYLIAETGIFDAASLTLTRTRDA